MNKIAESQILLQKLPRPRVPVKLLLIMGLVLIIAVSFVVSSNIRHDQERIQAAMKSRADVLIWALEGGVRSMSPEGRGGPARQALVQEVAKQPSIAYMAITDQTGTALVHSNPEKVGTKLHTAKEMQECYNLTESRGYFTQHGQQEVYEVVKLFVPVLPVMGRGHGHSGASNSGHGFSAMPNKNKTEARPSMGAMCNIPGALEAAGFGNSLYGQGQGLAQGQGQELGLGLAARDYYIFVGIDAQPFRAVFKENVISSVLLAFFIVLACLCGLVLFFFIQNYKTSRLMLQDAQTLTLQVFESLPIGVFTLNQQGQITLLNRHSASMLNITGSSKTPRSIYDYPFADWKGLMDELEKGLPIVERELELGAWDSASKLEKTIPVSLSASKITGSGASGYLFLLRDLGEVRSLQKQIRLNERLTALGNLAAGVAHEIRNPLSSIKGYATYLLEKLRGDEAAFTTAQMMIQEVERLNRVVSELLGVAKAGQLALQQASLLPVVQRAIRLVTPEAEEKGVALQFEQAGLDEANTLVQIDADKFIQALLNLLINAVQATPPGKKVRLVMARVALNHNQNNGFDLAGEGAFAPAAPSNFSKPSGPHCPSGAAAQNSTAFQTTPGGKPSLLRNVLLLSINDDGPGMSFEVLSKIFTPYFSTKPEGTGLGLTIAHQIIEQHGGEIKVHSLPGKGTQFTIILPLVSPPSAKESYE